MTREYTNKALELVEEGAVSAESMLTSCLVYMSEASVKDMLWCDYDIDLDDDENDDDENDDENEGEEVGKV